MMLADKIGVLLVLVVSAGVLAGVLVVPTAFALTDIATWINDDLLNVPPLPDAENPPQTSYIHANDGSLLAEINFEEIRVPVTLDEIPDVLINAVIATEDADFWNHNGVNYQAILRAARDNAAAGEVVGGGSTITQQYVKKAFIEAQTGELAEQSIDRKIKEAVWAIELERRLTKEEILERYLNRSFFGSGVYGVGTAAERYFNKTVGELTLGEAATLAGIVRSPTNNNPIDNFANAVARRNIVLDQMAREGYISRQQAESAKATELVLDPQEPDAPDHPFWVDWVTRILVNEAAAEALGSQVDALNAMGETPEDRIATVFQAGLRIHTTLDPTLQAYAEDAIRDALVPEDATPLEIAQQPMGAIVSVEPGTGAIRTMAIGPREWGECDEPVGVDEDGRVLCDKTKFNPAVPSDIGSIRVGRQPGSSFKPYVITAALEAGFPPNWTIDATGPAIIPGCDNGGPWEVNNSGGNGLRDMYSGVKASSNVFHAKLIKEVGPSKVVDVATRLGIRRSPLPAECSLGLGAIEVFPLEHATAYATLANRGVHCAPHAITRIEQADGTPFYEYQPRCERAVDTAVADRVVDIMEGPVTAGGTAPHANLGRWPTRGKTGTTNDYRDAWFMGFVRQLATAAWVGYENGVTTFDSQEAAEATCRNPVNERAQCVETRLMTNVTIGGTFYRRVFGGTIPAPMWKAYMVQAVANLEPQGFPKPGPLPSATVPDFVSLSTIAEVQEAADRARINVVFTEIEDFRPAGTFVSQEPPAGTIMQAGRAVTVFVSDGTGTPPTVPNVIGMLEEEAQDLLLEYGYIVVVREVTRLNADLWDRVVGQDPEAGADHPPGEGQVVEIQVAVPPGGQDDPDPEPTGPGNGTGNGNGNGGGGGP